MNPETLKKYLNLQYLKSLWKPEWTSIALAIGGAVLLLILLVIAVKCISRARRRRKQRRAEQLGYDPRRVSGYATSSAYTGLMCGILLAAKFLDSADNDFL